MLKGVESTPLNIVESSNVRNDKMHRQRMCGDLADSQAWIEFLSWSIVHCVHRNALDATSTPPYFDLKVSITFTFFVTNWSPKNTKGLMWRLAPGEARFEPV